MVKEYIEEDYKVMEFDSLLSHAEYLQPHIGQGYSIEREVKADPSFYGRKLLPSVIDEMKYGDNEATAVLLDGIKQMENTDGNDNTGMFMDINGVAYDMGSVVNGEPECCIAMDSPEVKPVIKIAIDLGYSGDVPAKVINYRSIGIVNLINTLQAQGYILEVYIVRYAKLSGGNKKYSQKVKIDTDNLCISQLSCATSVGYYRGSCWLTTAIQDNWKGYNGQSSSSISTEMKSKFKKDGVFYIGGEYSDSNMGRLRDGADGTKYIAELYNEFTTSIGGTPAS